MTRQTAPAGKFRIIGIDTFEGEEWLQADVDTLDEAKRIIREKTAGEQILKMYVFDDAGTCLAGMGSY